ncbi:MAG: MFS transporter [Pseudomonadales bacterium]
MTAHPANAIVTRYPALGFPQFRRYWFASFASVGATQLVTLGQGWLIYELSGSAFQLGVLGAAASIPNILMTLLGGVIADRFDRRRILMVTSAITAVLLAVLTVLDLTGLVTVWHVLTIAALISLVSGLDWPARASIFPLLLDRHAYLSGVALNAFIWQATRMAIPAAGGLLIAVAGDTWPVFAFAAVGFAVMVGVLLGIRVTVPPPAQTSPLEQLKEGFAFILNTDVFRWLLGLTFVGMFFAMSYVQIMPVFANLLGTDEAGYGYLLSAGGLGSVVGTLLIGMFQESRRLGWIMFGGAAASVVLLVGFAATTSLASLPLALALTFLVSASASAWMIISMTVMQLLVPDALRGRVMGIHTIGYSLIPLGGLFLGSLAESLGADWAVITGAGIYLLAIGVTVLSQAKLRSLDGGALQADEEAAGIEKPDASTEQGPQPLTTR